MENMFRLAGDSRLPLGVCETAIAWWSVQGVFPVIALLYVSWKCFSRPPWYHQGTKPWGNGCMHGYFIQLPSRPLKCASYDFWPSGSPSQNKTRDTDWFSCGAAWDHGSCCLHCLTASIADETLSDMAEADEVLKLNLCYVYAHLFTPLLVFHIANGGDRIQCS